MIVWLTPAGTEDEGGVKQPAYLNFDTALLGPPHGNEMQVGLQLPRRACSHSSILPQGYFLLLQHNCGARQTCAGATSPSCQ